jgi:S1-C subfamily serine protease
MRATRLLGLLVLLVAACTPTLPEEDKVPDVLRLREATVTLFPGHCAGVVVADGRHALTAAHCIDGPLGSSQPVVLRSGKSLGGEVVMVDTERDVAVLRLAEVAPVEPLPVATLAPAPGDGLLFAGRNDRHIAPQKVELRRLGRCPSLPHVPAALFTTLHGEKGDSGAPVVDERLQVVGLVHGGAACSIATPTAEVAPLVDTLVAQAAHPDQGMGVGGSGLSSSP